MRGIFGSCLTVTQLLALVEVVNAGDDGINGVDLMRRVKTTNPSTFLLKPLLTGGFVRQVTGKNDREVRVAATSKGRKLFNC